MPLVTVSQTTGALVAPSLVDAFLKGRTQTTFNAYSRDLATFSRFLDVPTATDAANHLLALPHGQANGTALAYRASMIEAGLAPATVNRRLAALRSLVKLANTLGMVPWRLEVESVKSQAYRDTRGPGRDAYRALLDVARDQAPAKASRDVALVHFLHDLGLRRGEVVALDLADLNTRTQTLKIVGKGCTEATPITIPAPTFDVLLGWLAHRGDAPGALFTNFDRAGKGHRLTGSGLYSIVRGLGEKIDIQTRPHGLRHLAITEALNLTKGDLRAVQRFSRHRDVRTLNVYDDNRADLGGEVAALVAGA